MANDCAPGNRCSDMTKVLKHVEGMLSDITTLLNDKGWIKKIFFSGLAVLVLSAAVGGLFSVMTHFEESKQTTLLQAQESFNEEQKEFNRSMITSMNGFSDSLDNIAKLVYRESRRNDLQDYYLELNSVKDNEVREQNGMKKIPTRPVPFPEIDQ